MIFRDRQDAGQQLARRLRHLANEHPLVLALPRGGVPVAFEIATALKADLDLLFVRKLGAPGHEELGLGAVVDGADPQLVLNEDIVRDLAPSPNYLHAEMQRQRSEEHTSELQSLMRISYAVFCLKKKNTKHT